MCYVEIVCRRSFREYIIFDNTVLPYINPWHAIFGNTEGKASMIRLKILENIFVPPEMRYVDLDLI